MIYHKSYDPYQSRLCKWCDCSWGSHRAVDQLCPANEGKMDWEKSCGHSFEERKEVIKNEQTTQPL